MFSLGDFVSVYTDALSPEECARLIAYFAEHPDQRYLGSMRGADGPVVDEKFKFVEQLDIPHGIPEDDILASAVSRVGKEYVSVHETYPRAGIRDEGYHIKRYQPHKHFYDWHVDNDVPWSANRLIAVLFYLNDVEKGGETEFKFGLKVKPERGKAIIFPCNWMYSHRALASESGFKYIVNTFIGY